MIEEAFAEGNHASVVRCLEIGGKHSNVHSDCGKDSHKIDAVSAESLVKLV